MGQTNLFGSVAEVHRAIYEICCKRWHLYFAGLNRERGVAARMLGGKILEVMEFELILEWERRCDGRDSS